jgi:homoserine kinase
VKITVRVPATVANLGPGFDCLALALELFNEVTVDTEAEPGVVIEGEEASELPTDSSNLIVRSMNEAASRIGRPLPPVAVRSVNRIPLERGLGSSAAAVVSGLVLAYEVLLEPRVQTTLLDPAAELEGHADNVAAGLFGGLTIAYLAGGRWRAERLEPSHTLRPVLYVSEQRSSTAAARRMLPRSVAFEDAVFTAGRAALAVHALIADPDLLPEAMRDRLHEDIRLSAVPESRALLGRLRERGIPACLAGSGPSILAFDMPAIHPLDDLHDLGPDWRVVRVPWSPEGPGVRRS